MIQYTTITLLSLYIHHQDQMLERDFLFHLQRLGMLPSRQIAKEMEWNGMEWYG
jgi:hypothetical protein